MRKLNLIMQFYVLVHDDVFSIFNFNLEKVAQILACTISYKLNYTTSQFLTNRDGNQLIRNHSKNLLSKKFLISTSLLK